MDINKLVIKYNIVIEYNGVKVLDSEIASLLKAIGKKGSILAAARSLGIPYSRAWETIIRIERVFGEPIIVTRRGGSGGGGAELTELAKKLLEIYTVAEKRMPIHLKPSTPVKYVSLEPSIRVAYSHDPLLEVLLGVMEKKGYNVEGLCLGSSRALATLALGETDIACIHLFDPGTKTYNKSFVEKSVLLDKPLHIGGYRRELVFALNPSIEVNDLNTLLKMILEGRIRIVNRNKGSGTRIYFDYVIESFSKKHGITLDKNRIRGYETELYTHLDVAKYIASGKADAGLTLKYAAQLYGLKQIHITWEFYECYTLKSRVDREPIIEFKKLLKKENIVKYINNMPGYRLI